MREHTAGWIAASVAMLLVLAACGGGSGNDTPANAAPVANAGPAQSVVPGAVVTLSGSASTDAEGPIASYTWTQTAGPAVALVGATTASPTFTAPAVTSATTLTFSLVVRDNDAATSTAATVTVTVNAPAATTVALTGQVRFERVAFLNVSPFTLSYGAPVLRPARGIIVRALEASTGVVLATGATDAAGVYTFTLPVNASITLQAVARMQRDAGQPLPRWDVRVQDGTAAGAVAYSFTSAAFNTGVGTRDIVIPTGFSASGSPIGTRASGPFAILDTVYTAMQTVLAVAPMTEFPALYVDWAGDNLETFFTTQNGQHLSLAGNATEDTDEFDQHLVLHEFGHYIEFNFSRFDSIGGSHALGERLDMRVAFSEGFATAFAAIALNDPVMRDSYVINGQPASGRLNVEDNPPTSASFNQGCWCNEASVWSILWDLHDATADANDTVGLGFGALWEAFTGTHRATPALASIFSYVAAVKDAQPASAAAINTLVAAQNINGTNIDAFGTTQATAPFAGLLPLYANITMGSTVVLRTTDDAGLYNKAGNRRYVRFTPAGSGSVAVRVVLRTSNPSPQADPDFLVFRFGEFAGYGTAPPPQPEEKTLTLTGGETYIFDVYDCANACDEPQGIRGDYDITLTINQP